MLFKPVEKGGGEWSVGRQHRSPSQREEALRCENRENNGTGVKRGNNRGNADSTGEREKSKTDELWHRKKGPQIGRRELAKQDETKEQTRAPEKKGGKGKCEKSSRNKSVQKGAETKGR